jgi:hypothetical protein
MADEMSTEPTDEGRKRYPPDGIYDLAYPCTCQPSCPFDCKGQCGCKACHAAYGDFLSVE